MPISDSDRAAAIGKLRDAEARLQAHKPKADPVLYEFLRNILNAVKQLAGDQSPSVE